jgi:hypothetical protein
MDFLHHPCVVKLRSSPLQHYCQDLSQIPGQYLKFGYKPAGTRDFCLLQDVQIGTEAHLTFSLRMGLLSRAYSGRGVTLTTRQHVTRRLKISRNMRPIPNMSVRRGRWRLYLSFVPATLGPG